MDDAERLKFVAQFTGIIGGKVKCEKCKKIINQCASFGHFERGCEASREVATG